MQKRRHKGANESNKKHKLITDAEKGPKNKVGRPPTAKGYPSILKFLKIEKRPPAPATETEEETSKES